MGEDIFVAEMRAGTHWLLTLFPYRFSSRFPVTLLQCTSI